ncbi:hypothetical protein AMJ52_07910 [candidate division TA06 bacterium DG_78]|uniref:YicC family protein n=1 Tax=candidate division TA06 bacterium DG_78 TaxID=1703772 RepID=A0A0S7YBZ5_UNCT6|nr:MAG: hypothetical protein AMJ52_07910 [candidate division TA06 bacterium DG_78]
MPYSMTGVGRTTGAIKDPPIKFDVEIKSYNHRFLEISIRCPNTLLPFENEIRRSIQMKVSRGHIIVVIQQDRDIFPTTIDVDKPLLAAYLRLADELKKNYNVSGDIDVNTLLAIPGLIKFSQTQKESKNLYNAFKPILEKALDAFIQMKKREGENIARDIKKSIDRVERNIRIVDELIPKRNEHYKDHLLSILKDYTKNFDEDRFYQEVLYLAERTDVTEECKRLNSHVLLFKESLKDEDHPGRQLNFLLQEMQREANTLSVKANYLDISKAVVQIKEEIEKIREQVQNLE